MKSFTIRSVSKQLFILIFIGIAKLPFIVKAETSLLLNYGSGLSDDLIQSYNINSAKQFSLGLAWKIETNFQQSLLGYQQLEIETYASQISKRQQTMNITAIRPILSFQLSESSSWYWQLGAGLSYFDEKELLPAKLSTNFQFATMLGLGTHLGKTQNNRLTLRYNHYSNAYTKHPNPGIDTISLDWHWRFSS